MECFCNFWKFVAFNHIWQQRQQLWNNYLIEDASSGFTVNRSGAMVYLETSSTGTFIKIPATKISQTLTFAGGVSYINNGKVMLDSKEVTLTEQTNGTAEYLMF